MVHSLCETHCFGHVVGFLVCPHQLGFEGSSELWKLALQDGYVLTIIRDEHILIHGIFEKQLQDLKTKEYVHVSILICCNVVGNYIRN